MVKTYNVRIKKSWNFPYVHSPYICHFSLLLLRMNFRSYLYFLGGDRASVMWTDLCVRAFWPAFSSDTGCVCRRWRKLHLLCNQQCWNCNCHRHAQRSGWVNQSVLRMLTFETRWNRFQIWWLQTCSGSHWIRVNISVLSLLTGVSENSSRWV